MGRNWPVLIEEWLRGTLRDPGQHFRPRRRRHCPCCGYEGYFITAKRNIGPDFRCPNCASRPRDRQIALWLEGQGMDLGNRRILHFAPEWPLFRRLNGLPGYVGGDIQKRRNANAVVDITAIGFPDGHFDMLICNHVLEHVPDDRRAMAETYRVLSPGGLALFSVPQSAVHDTWEPPEGMPVAEVERVCGWDHKRLYGLDFGDKLAAVGYRVSSFTANDGQRERHALLDDRIYVAEK